MKFGSVCSGIEAASVAWEPLGWEAQWFSEIEHFPSAVLNHRFPTVPNLGDMTLIHQTKEFNDSTIDLLVGGTPCQSFSVAGLRKGLTDPRGNLMLTFLSLAQRKKPRWIVWENVPGVLSSNGGRDFATFLTALGDIGYGFAYRVLDAQYIGGPRAVPQRRRRVFVIGFLGDWRPAGAVLFESESLSGNTKKSREKRKATSADAQGGSGGGGFRMTAFGEYADDNTASTLKQRDYKDATDLVAHKPSWWNGEQTAATLTKQNVNGAQRMPDKDNFGAVLEPIAFTTEQTPKFNENQALTLTQSEFKHNQCVAQPIAYENRPSDARVKPMGETCQTLTSRLGTGGGNLPLVQQPLAVDCYNFTTNENTTQTIRSQNDKEHIGAVLQPTYCLAGEHPQKGISKEIAPTLPAAMGMGGGHTPIVPQPTIAIRRLTPRECERLQGFPDDWTLIPYRNKSADLCPDGPRYKACGNSMAVPVMRWIGERIEMVEKLLSESGSPCLHGSLVL